MSRHRGVVIWFTGLSGSGKTTLSQLVSQVLATSGYKVEVLDGDVVRKYLSRDLGFSRKDRDENLFRISFVAQVLARHGVYVIVSAISPYHHTRQRLRAEIKDFVEVYVNAPIEVCEQRDVKGLYKKARQGKIKGFTGITDPYEAPTNPEVECNTDRETISESVEKIVAKLRKLGYLKRFRGAKPNIAQKHPSRPYSKLGENL